MNRITTFVFILCSSLLSAQTCPTEPVTLRYSNGHEVFNVCRDDPNMTFEDDKEYYWYTEFSKIKSTKGGAGGQLLHGEYKFFDAQGNLIKNQNFKLGLEHGKGKVWDEKGNIIEISEKQEGEYLYWKYKTEDGEQWQEHIGKWFEEGYTIRYMDKWGNLNKEEIFIPGGKGLTRIYFEGTEQIDVECQTALFGTLMQSGLFKDFHRNGKLSVEGELGEGEFTEIQVGTWNFYNEDGSLKAAYEFKGHIERFDNGNKKEVGAVYYDSDSDDWLRHGKWKIYNLEGRRIETKEYEYGRPINN